MTKAVKQRQLKPKHKSDDEQTIPDELIEHLFEAVACFDHNEKLVRWNTALNFVGNLDWLRTRPSFTQMAYRVVELLAQDSSDEVRLWWELAATGTRDFDVPTELCLSDGKVFIVKCRQLSSGGYVMLFNDVTNLSKRGMALEQSNRDLEQFAYIASHDLQEPLRMVASFTQLLQKRYDKQLDSVGREYIPVSYTHLTLPTKRIV